MAKWIIRLEWREDRSVASHIVVDAPNATAAKLIARLAHGDHHVVSAEHAPHLEI